MQEHSYQNLIVWQKAIDLVTEIYAFTATLPDQERYGLTSQLRRAGVSIASNIAEGHGRGSSGEYYQFLCQARGSLYEVQTQIIITFRLGYVATDRTQEINAQCDRVGRLLNALIASIQKKRAQSGKATSTQRQVSGSRVPSPQSQVPSPQSRAPSP